MKQFLKKFLSLSLLVGTIAQANTVSTFINRSQSRYAIHQDVGAVGHTHDIQHEMEGWWGTTNAVVGWQQTFDEHKIAHALFGSDLVQTVTTVGSCGNWDENSSILVQGSTVANRNASAWLADYLYLPTDFNSAISFHPRIQTFFADLSFFLGLDEWWEGGYFQVHGPIVYTKWGLGFHEQITSAGTSAGSYPAGYFSPASITNTSLLASVQAYMSGQVPFGGSLTQADTAAPPISQTITFQPLKFAKMGCAASKDTGFADLRAELGWNFWRNEDYHLGVNIQAAAPTGNRYQAEHLFHAVVGNGKHWELGGGVTGHYVFYRSSSGEKHFGFYGDLNVTHLFKASSLRTFDLKGLPNSKYMLATMFGANTQNVGTGTATPATKQFADTYAPVANLTTLRVGASSAAQIDLVANFNYTCKHFSWDLGYNFYYRSAEDIDCSDDCEPCDNNISLCTSGQANTWALKGDSRMFGFAATGATTTATPTVAANQAVALSATNSAATIHGGSNIGGTVTLANSANAKIDNPQIAYAGGTTAPIELFTSPTSTVGINTSIQPVFLSCAQIDTHGTQSMSHTVFTHLQYNFEAGDDWTPYLGVGGMGEFGMSNHGGGNGRCNTTVPTVPATSTTSCSSNDGGHRSVAASYWGVWVKGGISFS